MDEDRSASAEWLVSSSFSSVRSPLGYYFGRTRILPLLIRATLERIAFKQIKVERDSSIRRDYEEVAVVNDGSV